MRTVFLPLYGRIEVGHIGDQIERLRTALLPDRQDADWPIHAGCHPGGRARYAVAAHRFEIADVKLDAVGTDQDVAGGAANILPAVLPDCGLQVGAVKLAV